MPEDQRERSVPQIRLEQPLPEVPLPISPITPRIRIQIPDQLPYEPYRDEESEEESSGSGEVGQANGKILRGVREQYSDNHLSPIVSSRDPRRQLVELHTTYREQLSPSSPVSRSGISISISRPQSPSIVPSNASQVSVHVSPRTITPPVQQNNQTKPPEYEPMYDYLRSLPRPIHFFTSPNSNTFLSPTSRPESPVDYDPYHDEPFIITLSPLSPSSRPNRQEVAPPSYEELYLQHSSPRRQDELHDLVRQMDSEGSWAEEICKFIVGMIMLALCVVGVGLAFNWGKGGGPQQCRGPRC